MTAESVRLRASMLSHFDVPWLGAVEDPDALDRLLLEDCSRVSGVDGVRYWAMDDAVRRGVVAEASQTDLLEALGQLQERPDDQEQWAIETFVNGDALQQLQDADVEQLRALASVARWLDVGLGEDVELVINNRLRFTELLGSLQAVATEHFLGRDPQLFGLAAGAFVGGPPVLVRGLGGVGKSALVARYVVGAVETLAAQFAYLNFDDTSLDPRFPASLVTALVRQLALQVAPHQSRLAARLIERARDRLRTGSRATEVQSRSLQFHGGEVADLLADAGRLVDGGRPLILVFDTLEEVQRRDQSAMYALASFLGEVRGTMPTAQLVLAGRAPIPELTTGAQLMPGAQLMAAEIVLEGLERPDAVQLLGRLYDRGDVDLEEVVSQVGTSPLCIRLAAEILKRSSADEAMRGLELRRVGVEGELYRRLLGAIPDQNVKRLAHPGLTLRRITPELITEVLAGPCGVTVPDVARARQLFEGLAAEAVLVEHAPGDYWTLIHRADVRRMMLARLAAEEPEKVPEIHHGAVRYYAARDDVVARTEELYHRLMLGEDAQTLERHWDQRALTGLSGSIDELPPSSRAYLASKDKNLGISDEDLREADLQTRRMLVEQRVQELIGEKLVAQARQELDAHVLETGDESAVISDLQIQVLELAGQFSEALDTAAHARAEAARIGSVAEFVTFTLHYARLAERTNEVTLAYPYLNEALEFTRSLEPTQTHQVLELRLISALLGARRRSAVQLPSPGRVSVDERLADRAIELYESVGLTQVRKVPGLLRDLAAEVGPRSPALLQAALQTIGVSPVEAKRVIEDVEHDEPAWAEDIERGEAGGSIAGLIDTADESASAQISESVSEIYQSESDSAIDYTPAEQEFEEGSDASA